MWGENDDYDVLANGGEYCFKSLVTFSVYYCGCTDDRNNLINRVELEHYVDGRRRSKNTERVPLYFLYGDKDGSVTYRDAIAGKNRIIAKVNGGKMDEINFTLKKCE